MTEPVSRELLQRGVWRAPYLVPGGVPVLIAIDRFGVVRKHIKLAAGVSELRAAGWLTELLDRVDPVPRLRLVKSFERERPTREIDPRLYSDPRSPLAKQRYIRSLVRAAAWKAREFRD